MCTVTWLRAGGALELWASRDERRVRGPEVAPYADTLRGVRFAAPRDADAGGTWIVASERGLVLTVLNGHLEPEDAAIPAGFESRGLLVLDLADAADPAEVEARVAAADLARYRSFHLLALAAGAPARLLEWDGARLAVDRDADARAPLVSSAHEPDDVARRRRAVYQQLVARRGAVDAALLSEYHASHADGPGPRSVCMHRDDAETRSLSRAVVEGDRVRLEHTAGPPCRPGARTAVTLARRAARAAHRT